MEYEPIYPDCRIVCGAEECPQGGEFFDVPPSDEYWCGGCGAKLTPIPFTPTWEEPSHE